MLVLSGCTEDAPSREAATPSPRPGVTIEVSATEFALAAEPRDGLIPADYLIVLRNEGSAVHALAIRGPGVDEATPQVQPGEGPVELQARLRPGSYVLWCPVGDHRDRGMETELIVEAL